MADREFKRPRLIGILLLVPALALIGFAHLSPWHTLESEPASAGEPATLGLEIYEATCEGEGCVFSTDDYRFTAGDVDLAPLGDVMVLMKYAAWGASVLGGLGFLLFLFPQFGANYPYPVRRLSVAFLVVSLLLTLAAPFGFLLLIGDAYTDAGLPPDSFWGGGTEEVLGATVENTWRPGYGWYAFAGSTVLTLAAVLVGWTPLRIGQKAAPAGAAPATEPEEPTSGFAQTPVMTDRVLPRDAKLRCPNCQAVFMAMGGTRVNSIMCGSCGRTTPAA